MPVLISAIAHDWVYKNHNWKEDSFKAALFEHKIYEDRKVAEHMQKKQFELMMMAQQMNPMMGMGMPGGMGGPGAGQHTKMSNQIMIGSTMVGLCEALIYGHKAGLELD